MKFKYKAITISGGKQTGKIEASNKERAIEQLQKHKLVVISVDLVREFLSLKKFLPFLYKVSSDKIVVFSKELSVLLSAGIPIVESLRILYDQEDNIYFREKIFMISNMVDDGSNLSSALSSFPDIFSDFFINIIKSGEASGKVQESFYHLSEYIEKQYLLVSKVKNALLYPAVILGGFALVGAGMMVFVVPQLVSIFEENQQELPLPTKVLIMASSFMQHNFVLLALIFFVICYVFRKYIKTPEGKGKLDRLVLKVPKINNIFQKFYMARFTGNLSMLISSGIPIMDALQISGDVVGNEVYKEIIYNSIDEVEIGGSIAYTFEKSEHIPLLVSKMIRVGEKTGRLDVILKDISEFYAKEVDIAIDGLTALIEPILIFVLGAGVGVLVASILMPIYQMTSMI